MQKCQLRCHGVLGSVWIIWNIRIICSTWSTWNKWIALGWLGLQNVDCGDSLKGLRDIWIFTELIYDYECMRRYENSVNSGGGGGGGGKKKSFFCGID